MELNATSDDDHVGPDALNGGDDRREALCRCGHTRAVHAGHDSTGRCILRSCSTMCAEFRRKVKT